MADKVEIITKSRGVIRRVITALDGLCPPDFSSTLWDEVPNPLSRRGSANVVVDVYGSKTTANDPILYVRPYRRRYNRWVDPAQDQKGSVVPLAGPIGYARPRVFGLGQGIVVAKTGDAGATWTNFSAQVMTGGTITLSSLDTYANGDYLLVGLPVQFMGFDSTISATNSNASVLTGYYGGTAWTNVGVSFTDGTISSGNTFGLSSGQVTWARPHSSDGASLWSKGVPATIQAALDGMLIAASAPLSANYYWMQFRVSGALDGSVTLSQLDLLMPVRIALSNDMEGGSDYLVCLESIANGSGITDAASKYVSGNIYQWYA